MQIMEEELKITWEYEIKQPAPSKIWRYEVSSLLQKFFTSSSLTDGSSASTTKQASVNCWSKLVSSVSFPVPKLQVVAKI